MTEGLDEGLATETGKEGGVARPGAAEDQLSHRPPITFALPRPEDATEPDRIAARGRDV